MRPRELNWVALDGGSGAHERPGAGGGDRRGASGGAETAQSDSSSIHVTISPEAIRKLRSAFGLCFVNSPSGLGDEISYQAAGDL